MTALLKRLKLFALAAFVSCICVACQNSQRSLFKICDDEELITAKMGSIVNNEGQDCTRIIKAPHGWRIVFLLHDLFISDGDTNIHDGGRREDTLKYTFYAGFINSGVSFYSSSNALLIHVDKSLNKKNKLNASFEMLLNNPKKCSCPPVVNGNTVCSFPPYDNKGIFYINSDPLDKVCTTTCDASHETSERRFYSQTTEYKCNLDAKQMFSNWMSTKSPKVSNLFNPKLISCKMVIPATQVLTVNTFVYMNIHCNAVNTTMITKDVRNFLVKNHSDMNYFGECFKANTENCSVNPVVVTCSSVSNNSSNSQIRMEVRDNVNNYENGTLTSELFQLLFDDFSKNFSKKLKHFVVNYLVIGNTTAMSFRNIGNLANTICPKNHAFLANRKCIQCPQHSFGKIYTDYYLSFCEICPKGKRRLPNETICINGSQIYPESSNNNCVHKCELGKYFNNVSGLCEWCDYGFYQNSLTALNPVCHKCPEDNTTAFVGAHDVTSCIQKCQKGQYAQHLRCNDCALGYYLPYEGNRFRKCFKCPSGNTTLQVATVNITGCVEKCTLGQYFNITQRKCVLCPNNTYQDVVKDGNNRFCKTCPPNSITLSIGSSSISACLGPCNAGEYLDIMSQTCKSCPLNTYNEESNRTFFSCTLCPKHQITSNEGSNNQSRCIYQCIIGEYFNLTTETCRKCSNNTYQDVPGQSKCKQCNGNTFTLTAGSKTCISPCRLGEYLNKSSKACEKCPIGYFQNHTNYVGSECFPCPVDFYTDAIGSFNCSSCSYGYATVARASTSMLDCVEKCEMGYFLNHTLRVCEKCPIGSYQDLRMYRQESCTSCGRANLTTLERGARSREQCVGYCASSPCFNGAKCTNVENGFNCTCGLHLAGKQCETIVDVVDADKMTISVIITSLVWNNTLNDKDSEQFKVLAHRIENEMRNLFRNDTSFRTVKALEFRKGSVICLFEVNCVAGIAFNSPFDTLTNAIIDGKLGSFSVNKTSLSLLNETCGTPLGMENGRIPNSALSSANKDNIHPFTNARLHHNGPGWTPRVYRIEDAYLQVDFGLVVQLTGIATQGSSYDGGNWLRGYYFNYSINGDDWMEYKEDTVFYKASFIYDLLFFMCIFFVLFINRHIHLF